MFNTKKQNAFTLVELIVVIVILAILATIAFFTFKSQSSSARDSTRMSDMSNISKWLLVFNAISGKYPFPDKKVSILSGVTLLGYQWIAWESVIRSIKLSWLWKDPLDDSNYTYNINFSQNRYQLLWFLENMRTLSSRYTPFSEFGDVFAESYTDRYPYEKWDILWIILDKTWWIDGWGITYTPVQYISSISSAWKVDVTAPSSSGYLAVTDNSPSSITWAIIISVWKTYTGTGTSTGIQYNSCEPISYSGYSIPSLPSWWRANPIKSISYWTGDINASCFNWMLSYWTENINCISWYVLQGWACVADLCTGDAPEFSISNWAQKAWVSWSHNIAPWQCTYVCQAWYFSNWTSCIAASAGNYVSLSWATVQTQCTAWSYQSGTWQTSCNLASAGYYVAGAGASSQVACAAWSYQSETWQTICNLASAGYYASSSAQSSQTQCSVWSYQANTGQSSCTLAWIWQYQDQLWQSTVKNCTNKPASNSAYTSSSWLWSNACPWSCSSSYHNESNVCVDDTRSCPITNWAWSQTWNWSSWNSCIPTSCNSWYYSNWSACVVPAWWWDATNWYTYYRWAPVYPKTCNELLTSSSPNYKIWSTSWDWSKFSDGIYYLKPDSSAAFKAYCDMTTDGWGWTIVASDWLSALTQSLSEVSTVPKPNQAWMLMPFISAKLKDFASEMRVISLTDLSKVFSYDVTPSWLWENLSLKNSEYWYMYSYSPTKWFSGWAWSPHKCNFSLIVVWNKWCTESWNIATPADGSILGSIQWYPSTAYWSVWYSWQFTDWTTWLRLWWTTPSWYVWYYDRAQASYLMIRK
ncbi:MAG: hypothetical protein ACD_2C00004G0002 [uncultured bacterium (gcode 4)]|uniref:Fibrinogen C-terminal domain-containing protein n=1 Tax=uncultured bacterium (gcode 4) TaxID=1234023 RepID=K2FGR3_9BACT|nr:MAG: hypothetical protein ACD_2C00004G0002 [uncultured bacterium (gcode 4)]